jgi:hypothetical protein
MMMMIMMMISSLYLIKHHAVRRHALILGTRWRSVVRFRFQLLYPLDRKLNGCQSYSTHCGSEDENV